MRNKLATFTFVLAWIWFLLSKGPDRGHLTAANPSSDIFAAKRSAHFESERLTSEMKTYIKHLTIVWLAVIAAPPAQAEWSDWEYFMSQSGVDLYWKYNFRQCGTDIRWRAVNNSGVAVWPSVGDKVFQCRNGGVERRGAESVGSTNLRPGNSASTIADYCICENAGGVSNANITFTVRDP